MISPERRPGLAIALLLVTACAGTSPTSSSPAPLAARSYPVPAEVGILVIDEAAFAKLAPRLRADVEADLAHPELHDVDTLKDRYFLLGLLDAIDDRWPEALAAIDHVAALEERPASKLMTGLTIRVWADAQAHGGSSPAAFRAALERKVATMPVDQVRDGLSMLRTMGQVFTAETCRKLVNESLGPEVKDGTVSIDDAQAIAFQRYAVKWLVPVGKDIDDVLGAHGIEPHAD